MLYAANTTFIFPAEAREALGACVECVSGASGTVNISYPTTHYLNSICLYNSLLSVHYVAQAASLYIAFNCQSKPLVY